MRIGRVVVGAAVAVFLLSVAASAEVKLTLKNGRSFVADSCRDRAGKLVCEMPEGTVEIDRQDIASISDVKAPRQKFRETSAEEAAPASDSSKGNGKTEPEKKNGKSQPPADGKVIKGLSPEQIQRLDEINARKAVLKPERENLIKEREQLHEDVKNAGVVRSQEQFDGIKSRIADLETRINAFNDEVKKLNDEEAKLIEESKTQKQ